MTWRTIPITSLPLIGEDDEYILYRDMPVRVSLTDRIIRLREAATALDALFGNKLVGSINVTSTFAPHPVTIRASYIEDIESYADILEARCTDAERQLLREYYEKLAEITNIDQSAMNE